MSELARWMCFGPFELDRATWELRRDGELLAIGPKPFRLLLYLLEHRDRVVSKEEVLAAIWPDVSVSDTALSTVVKQIRQALGDAGAQQHWIRTLRGRGYQFVGPLQLPGAAREASDARVQPAARSPLHGVPRGLSMSFVGRDAELDTLERLFGEPAHVSVQASVEGLAGIGKTELALQLVHKLAHSGGFPGGIFWLDAEQPDLRGAWGGVIAEGLEIRGGSLEERCGRVLRQVAAQGEPVLIVLDNVASWHSSARPGPLPEGAHLRVLVTTRERNLGGPRFKHVDLGFLAEPHDREFLVGIAGRVPEPGLRLLLDHLGGHALGLEIAGAFLATYAGESAASYLEALRRGGSAEQEASTRVRYERTVADALQTMWDRLGELPRAAWLQAACFEPEPATRELADAVGLDLEARRALERICLIRTGQDGRWHMHRLTRAFGQQQGSAAQQRAAGRRFVEGCLELLRTRGTPALARYVADRAHFDAALQLAPEVLDAEAELDFLLEVGWPVLFQEGYATQAVARVFRRASQLAEQTGRDQAQFRAWRGLWTHAASRADWKLALGIASAIESAAAPFDGPRRLALLLSGVGFVCTGDIPRAAQRFDTAMARADADRALLSEPALATTGMFAALCALLQGRVQQALAWAGQCGARAERGADPGGLSMLLCITAAFRQIQGDRAGLQRCLEQSRELLASHDLEILRAFMGIVQAWADLQGEGPADPAVLSRIRACLAALDATEFLLFRPVLLSLAMSACASIREPEAGLSFAQDALAHVEKTDERLMEAEIWRLRAALAEPSERRRLLDRSLAISTRQGALWWSLRAAADRVDASPPGPERHAARERLEQICSAFGASPALPDLQRARALLTPL